jgi:hypothetical protein
VATRSGDDLVLTIRGTSDSVTLAGWVSQAEGVNHVALASDSSAHYAVGAAEMQVSLVGVQGLGGFEFAMR